MKISKLFHWLYCAVMFLPLLVIPIFAIYSHRHTIDTYSVTRDEVSFDIDTYNIVQLLDNGVPSFEDGYSDGYDYYECDDDSNGFSIDTDSKVELVILDYNNLYYRARETFYLLDTHKYYFSFDSYFSDGSYADECYLKCYSYSDEDDSVLLNEVLVNSSSYVYSDYILNNDFNGWFYADFEFFGLYSEYDFAFNLKYVSLFDLTAIFGVGNEPSKADFKVILDSFDTPYLMFGNTYSYIVDNGSTVTTVTYDDTDIGSQFVYDAYNVVDKYFNYDNVLNIGELYEWCNVNLFNGNATLGFFIFFHLLEYWLLTSLLWLIFDVLMYVPQLCHRWLDKASLE